MHVFNQVDMPRKEKKQPMLGAAVKVTRKRQCTADYAMPKEERSVLEEKKTAADFQKRKDQRKSKNFEYLNFLEGFRHTEEGRRGGTKVTGAMQTENARKNKNTTS